MGFLLSILALFLLPLSAAAETWVAFGDSITRRVAFGGPEGAWPDRVARATGHRVINSGVDGDTTLGAGFRIQRDVLAHHPDRVLIMFGVNDHRVLPDGREVVPPMRFARNLAAIVKQIQASGARVTLFTNRPLVLGDGPLARPYYLAPPGRKLTPDQAACTKTLCRYNAIIRGLSRTLETDLVDLWKAVVEKGGGTDGDAHVRAAGIDKPSKYFDGVHLGPGGHRLVTEAVLAVHPPGHGKETGRRENP